MHLVSLCSHIDFQNLRDREIERERKSEKGRRGGTRRQRQEIGVHQTTGRQVTVTVPHPAREPPTPSIGSRAKVELILM